MRILVPNTRHQESFDLSVRSVHLAVVGRLATSRRGFDWFKSGATMNRRQVLLATGLTAVSATAFSKTTLLPGNAASIGVRPPALPGVFALVPIEVDRRIFSESINEMRILRFLPSQTAPDVRRWDFDLLVEDNGGIWRTIYAWQLRRSTSGSVTAANSMRMRFPQGAAIGLSTNVQSLSGQGGVFTTRIYNGALSLLVTARQRTGKPPELMDLRYDPSRREVSMANGSPRDFESLLLQTT